MIVPFLGPLSSVLVVVLLSHHDQLEVNRRLRLMNPLLHCPIYHYHYVIVFQTLDHATVASIQAPQATFISTSQHGFRHTV